MRHRSFGVAGTRHARATLPLDRRIEIAMRIRGAVDTYLAHWQAIPDEDFDADFRADLKAHRDEPDVERVPTSDDLHREPIRR